jgi:hypothetical protein
MVFIKQFATDQCFLSINDRTLACVYQISVVNVKKIRSIPLQREQGATSRFGRPHLVTADQEVAIVEGLLRRASEGIFITKGELLNETEHSYGIVPTLGWLNGFLTRHR